MTPEEFCTRLQRGLCPSSFVSGCFRRRRCFMQIFDMYLIWPSSPRLTRVWTHLTWPLRERLP